MSSFNYAFIVLLVIVFELNPCDKWIVVTSIQHPTKQLKKLANIQGWRLLVVGDKKTPSDWHLENCEYLSPEKQLSLGYKLTPLLPWNHYCRKNIGYLYAIEHGATIIYDTDDDNEPLNDLEPLAEISILPILTSLHDCVNIYAYFEKTKLWPRGYPLDNLKNSSQFHLDKANQVHIGIEQGIVNGDPDVDAIFRLTQPHNDQIIFSPKQPCVLAPGKFCPINSQNTFFHKKAFLTLYLPSSVSMRVADIWRGYYAQKMLQLFNLSLAFSGPNAFQERNCHNLLHDFVLEQDLYIKSSNLIRFLSQWRTNTDNIQETMYSLFKDLVTYEFLKTSELELCKAWLD